LKLSKDGWAGLVVLATSLFLFWLTLDLKKNPLVPIGPEFYPRIVLGLTALLAAALLFFDLFVPKAEGKSTKANYGAVALHFAVFGVYVMALPWLGFRLATLLYVAVTNALLDPPADFKGWMRVAALAIGTAAVTYVVFQHYLTVLLPRGTWTGF
jgi:putative tricarboxylic transport membrane protein